MADMAQAVKRSEAKRLSDKARGKTRVNLGLAFSRWRALKERMGMKSDAELACFLMNRDDGFGPCEHAGAEETVIQAHTSRGLPWDSSFRWTESSGNRPEQPLKRSSSTETCDSVHYQYPLMMSSPNTVERETSVQSSENGTEPGKEDAAVQRQKNPDKQTATKQSKNKENRDIQEDEEQEFSTSLSVGDGRFLVDLGSSSEFIIDEECILQLFKSCRECNRQCTVRKSVKGLKLEVSQACCYCHSRCKWTNLPSDDDDKDDEHFQMNRKDSAS